ncbi:hypothetical protein AVEN_157743-1, partial [Araneus ventricosus]
MATDSESTLVESDNDNDSMLVSEEHLSQTLVPKEAFNPFLLIPTTSMFGGSLNKENDSAHKEPDNTKKSRRKRK